MCGKIHTLLLLVPFCYPIRISPPRANWIRNSHYLVHYFISLFYGITVTLTPIIYLIYASCRVRWIRTFVGPRCLLPLLDYCWLMYLHFTALLYCSSSSIAFSSVFAPWFWQDLLLSVRCFHRTVSSTTTTSSFLQWSCPLSSSGIWLPVDPKDSRVDWTFRAVVQYIEGYEERTKRPSPLPLMVIQCIQLWRI